MHRMLRRVGLAALGLFLTLSLGTAIAADKTWPREMSTDKGILTIYQPQPEKFTNNLLQGRAAISLVPKGKTAPVFGVFWFSGRVDTDRDAGTAMLRDITVTESRWPESTEAQQKDFSAFLTTLMPKTGIPISMERLRASLATAETERKSVEGLKHDPPKIVVLPEVAELLLYDGEPKMLAIKDSDFEYAGNCAFAVVKDKKTGTCYLSGGKLWYSAKDPKGPWSPIDKPPADVAKLVPPDTSKSPAPAKVPKIVVATEPTELISSDGPPSWQAVGTAGDLMYIANSETKVIREVATGKIFVLISGRWYRAQKTLDGPWSVVRPDSLPAGFKDIPPASALGDVRVSVAGTPEAEDAMLDAHVPQTAAIERSKAKLEVKYDGEPKFKKIDGTSVEYAVNTASQVLRIDGKFYACDQAVWFTADKATGPWKVADSVPMDEIKKIPPSEPVYNVTNVTVYESTPEVVYVGYTPGYLWSYPWYGVPIYGTGWYYPPYVSPYAYYPRPVTYGMHVSYNPYTGWGFGFTVSSGFLTVGIGFGGYHGGYYGGYYPPCGYRPPYYGGYPGGYPGGVGGIGGVGGVGGVGSIGGVGGVGGVGAIGGVGAVGGVGGVGGPGGPGGVGGAGGVGGVGGVGGAGGVGGPSASQLPSNNMYKNAANRDRVATSDRQRDASTQKASRVAKGPNNVYSDRNGNVARQTPQGNWQSRDQGQWKNSPSTSNRDLNRDASARQQGANRSPSSYGGSRSGSYGGSRGGSYGGSRGGGSRGGGGGRGGGGRR